MPMNRTVSPTLRKRLVTRSAFDLVFTLVVVTNSIFIGVELQLSVSEPNATHTGVQSHGVVFWKTRNCLVCFASLG